MRSSLLSILCAGLFALACGAEPPNETASATASGEAEAESIRLAFVTNSSSDFWAVARAGIRRAEREFDVEVDFQVPGRGTAAEQRQIIETLIAKGVQGMAVSVLDPKGSIGILDEAAARMPVVTQDSDCPESKRSAYIGTDNVEAGRRAGEELVRLTSRRAAGRAKSWCACCRTGARWPSSSASSTSRTRASASRASSR
jgi:ABC-type sugar transport system substrate-binding protein